jgi:hypothetical protein
VRPKQGWRDLTHVTGSDQIPETGRPSDPMAGSLPRPPVHTEILSVEQAITLREQAPELYDLWLKIAQEKAATANYVDRAPYEVPERLAQAGRPRALGALIVVLSFCGYLAWLGGPGPYIGGVIAIMDLVAMMGIFFGLRPDRLAEERRPGQKPLARPRPPGNFRPNRSCRPGQPVIYRHPKITSSCADWGCGWDPARPTRPAWRCSRRRLKPPPPYRRRSAARRAARSALKRSSSTPTVRT